MPEPSKEDKAIEDALKAAQDRIKSKSPAPLQFEFESSFLQKIAKWADLAFKWMFGENKNKNKNLLTIKASDIDKERVLGTSYKEATDTAKSTQVAQNIPGNQEVDESGADNKHQP
jgi:hypothetical protein